MTPLVSWPLVGRRVLGSLLVSACAALCAAGCGGARQDAREAKGTYVLEVAKASFAPTQSIARPTDFELQVRNVGAHAAPRVAVSIDSFSYVENYAGLAANQRPVWVIEQGPGAVSKVPVESAVVSPPGGATTAYVNTWTLGALGPGQTQTYRWRVTPVKAGVHTVRYTIAAGLAGKAKAQVASGAPVHGQLTADVASSPPARHVDPATGRVVPGQFPVVP
jgi:hypothetical protein